MTVTEQDIIDQLRREPTEEWNELIDQLKSEVGEQEATRMYGRALETYNRERGVEYGPWHDVKVTFETIGHPSALEQDFVYDVGHPVECGPSGCNFEGVLDDPDVDFDNPGPGTYRARVVMDHYEINGTGYTSDTLEWEPAGGETR